MILCVRLHRFVNVARSSTRFWLSIISYVGAGLWFLIICATRKRIYLAIAIVQEASAAISSMPVLIAYPILPMLGFILFLIPWIIYLIYLASSGEITTECMCLGSNGFSQSNRLLDLDDGCDNGCYSYRSFEYASNTKYAALYLLFTFFWTTQFITAWCVQTYFSQVEFCLFLTSSNLICKLPAYIQLVCSFVLLHLYQCGTSQRIRN